MLLTLSCLWAAYATLVVLRRARLRIFFFFNDTATTEIYTLSLHDALPISHTPAPTVSTRPAITGSRRVSCERPLGHPRSGEATSELQSPDHLPFRLLLGKKKKHPHMRYRYNDTTILHGASAPTQAPRPSPL